VIVFDDNEREHKFSQNVDDDDDDNNNNNNNFPSFLKGT